MNFENFLLLMIAGVVIISGTFYAYHLILNFSDFHKSMNECAEFASFRDHMEALATKEYGRSPYQSEMDQILSQLENRDSSLPSCLQVIRESKVSRSWLDN